MAVRPLKDGVIADFEITATMLKHFIRKVVKTGMFSKPRGLVYSLGRHGGGRAAPWNQPLPRRARARWS